MLVAVWWAGWLALFRQEVPIAVDLLPASIKLICEAGTGFNNIDLHTAKMRGIAVCNVPSYSTDAVAHLVITFVLNFSCSMVGGDLHSPSASALYPTLTRGK